jgi:hypothetical protein
MDEIDANGPPGGVQPSSSDEDTADASFQAQHAKGENQESAGYQVGSDRPEVQRNYQGDRGSRALAMSSSGQQDSGYDSDHNDAATAAEIHALAQVSPGTDQGNTRATGKRSASPELDEIDSSEEGDSCNASDETSSLPSLANAADQDFLDDTMNEEDDAALDNAIPAGPREMDEAEEEADLQLDLQLDLQRALQGEQDQPEQEEQEQPEMTTCGECQRVWDGNAQCPCGLNASESEEGDGDGGEMATEEQGDDDEASEQGGQPTPFQCGVSIIQELTTAKDIAKEQLPKLNVPVPVKRINDNFYAIMTVNLNDIERPLSMLQLLNQFARESADLNGLLNKHSALRSQLVQWMTESDTTAFPLIQRTSCCIDYENGVLRWGENDGRLVITFFEHGSDMAPADMIARAHFDMDFDQDWIREDIDTLLADSPCFKQYIETKFSADDIYPFGFTTGRDGDTKDISVRDAWLGFHGRLQVPVRLVDKWRCANYDYGITGSGKTVMYELIESFHGAEYCQTLQDAKHADKFTVNSRTAELRMLTAQDFGNGEPLTAAQAQKMIGGEKAATRDMQQIAGESQWKVPVWFIGNYPPPWKDESGALNNRLVQWYWEPQEGLADDSMLEKMKSEPRVPLIFLRAYRELHTHIKTTPSQQWDYPYFDKVREEAAVHMVPFVEFLKCGSFSRDGATYTITAQEDATVLLSRALDVFKVFQEAKERTTETSRVSVLKSYLSQASADPPLKLVEQRNLWKCLACDAIVLEEDDGSDSTCNPDCLNQCPPGVMKEGPARRRFFYKPRDRGAPRSGAQPRPSGTTSTSRTCASRTTPRAC